MTEEPLLSLDEAVRVIRGDARYADLVRDAYLDEDLRQGAQRFAVSAEFEEVKRMVGDWRALHVLDLGAGSGIASYAFASLGVGRVYSLEPSMSEEVGCRAIRRLTRELPVMVIAAYGEEIPLPDGELDVVYARQVLHHVGALPRVLRECSRVLKRGGVLLACREHVVRNREELKRFLANHTMHRLAGGENAFAVNDYLDAMAAAGFRVWKVLGPYESVINAFPHVKTSRQLEELPARMLERRLGRAGLWSSSVPGVPALVRAWLTWRSAPGRMYSFWASKT